MSGECKSGTVLTSEQIRETAEQNLDRLADWIGKYDNKASVALGIVTGMLGFWALSIPKIADWTFLSIASSLVSVSLLGLSIIYVQIGNYPRTKGPMSLFYFKSISKMSFDEFEAAFFSLTNTQQIHDLLQQCHVLSIILDHKFHYLKCAYWALFFAIPPWAFAIFLFKLC